MAKTKYNTKARTISESGFGTNSSYSGGRFYNKDGAPNLSVTGVSVFEKFSLYNHMLKLSSPKFLLVILLFYLLVNLFFALVYLLVGVENLGGLEQDSSIGKFFEAFFFSAQTLSTVGYGHVYPKSPVANTIASTESIIGLLALALATGMMYGRFSQPRAFIRYSKNALFAPYKDGTAVMFRMAPYKHNHLIDAEVKVTLVMKIEENGTLTNRFFTLDLELSKVNSLTMNWTIVHPINNESPFYGLTTDDLMNNGAELIVFTKAFDESFSNTVVSRTSYTGDEFIYGAKFILMYRPNEDNTTTILHIDKLDHYEEVVLPSIINQ